MRPLASVIIPAYNTEKYIGEMLECVINPTYENIEILVIDDGPTNGTNNVVKKFADMDSRISLIESDRVGYREPSTLESSELKEMFCFSGIQMI